MLITLTYLSSHIENQNAKKNSRDFDKVKMSGTVEAQHNKDQTAGTAFNFRMSVFARDQFS